MLLQKAIETPHSKCKCESELEVTLDRQNQLTPSVFDMIGTSYQQGPVLAPPKDRARQEDYLRPAQRSRRMTEQSKKEIPIKMPGNDKPLATIIEGRWYSVGKSDRPTLELTRTQKRRVQRQYCTFLKNKDDTQVLPETSSARRGKNLEVAPQAEQTTCQPQELTKAESPCRPSIHPASSSVNQVEPSQSQGESRPIEIEGQEDWTEEYEEQ
ncbi:unnamed protein product, partial [Prunus brigantina]